MLQWLRSLLTPLELIDRIASLVPPPRVNRHRYHGVLAPSTPLRDQVTALAPETATDKPALASGSGETDTTDQVSRSPARYLCATVIARLFERLATDYMVWNVTKDNIKVRMAVVDEDIRPQPSVTEKLPADPNDKVGFTDFITDGKLPYPEVVKKVYDLTNEEFGTDIQPPQ